MILEPGGLAVEGVGPNRQSLSFGAPASAASAAVAKIYGNPVRVEILEECSAGPLEVTNFGGLSLAAQHGKFVGWTVDARGKQPLPRTEAGIGIGSTLESVDDAYRVEKFESSLGQEFTANGFAGVLSGESESSTVSHFWAGATCIMR